MELVGFEEVNYFGYDERGSFDFGVGGGDLVDDVEDGFEEDGRGIGVGDGGSFVGFGLFLEEVVVGVEVLFD